MPSESKAQSIKLRMKFGDEWMHEHHFDNPIANLPYHVKKLKSQAKEFKSAVPR